MPNDISKQLPSKFQWIEKETQPKVLVEALRHYGQLEHVGKGSNPNIMQWAKEVGVTGFYRDDDIPWCGLFVGVVLQRCGYKPPAKLLSLGARNYATFGVKVLKGKECLFDIVVFTREGGGHVGFVVGENKDNYLVYGGNQGNAVGFAWIAKSRCLAIRRPAYKTFVPKRIPQLSFDGQVSKNEA